ncbi:MAG: DUF192 domain-containing protein [Actinomycetota bacterium]
MRLRSPVVLVLLLMLVAGACNSGDDAGERSSSADAQSPTSTALIDTGEDSLLLDVEVADDSKERQNGLMGRKSLPERSGMVFIFFGKTSGGFWMKNTLIPLSIAFFDRDGEILRILDMKPCDEDPCKVYEPGVSYWGALEVNQGAFEDWGVEVGDRIEVV